MPLKRRSTKLRAQYFPHAPRCVMARQPMPQSFPKICAAFCALDVGGCMRFHATGEEFGARQLCVALQTSVQSPGIGGREGADNEETRDRSGKVGIG